MSLTQQDFQSIRTIVREEVRDELARNIEPQFSAIRRDFGILQNAVDRFLQGLGLYHQEFIVYKAQQDRLRGVLVRKGVVTEQELSV